MKVRVCHERECEYATNRIGSAALTCTLYDPHNRVVGEPCVYDLPPRSQTGDLPERHPVSLHFVPKTIDSSEQDR